MIRGIFLISLLAAGASYGAPPTYAVQGSASLAPSSPVLTAVDPYAYPVSTDIMPARPFLYSVDENGLTITRFNDNQLVGTVLWPASLWIILPDGSNMEIPAPAGGWEPVAMTVSYPTEVEIANRVKSIPDLTPPWTFVYVVMARSGYEWRSNPNPALLQDPDVRDTLVPSTNPDTESSVLVQVNVSDPSFSAIRDPVAPTPPHMAGAILGHGAGQPAYDPKTSNIYVGNMPSNSLPADLASFVSVIARISDTVAASEPEVPGISKPVIRCGPQHPESGIPVGRPQAFACYDPSGTHRIDDNEHSGATGHYQWEFRNLPYWLTPHADKLTGQLDGILYGTPDALGEWFAEARVHNLDDEYGVFSDWTPIQLLVTPDAQYLPIKARFAVGEPASYPLDGSGECTLSGAPAWIDVAPVLNGCIIMGRAPISGEHYQFAMPGFREIGYPEIPIVFSGNVVGPYEFDPLPGNTAISGLAWHQVDKYADPSTEPAVLSGEFIGVEPFAGQLYRILQPPGMPQPPNERPAETSIGIDVVSAIGPDLAAALAADRADIAAALTGNLKVRFGQVVVEADRDIFVAAPLIADPTGADPTVISIGGPSISLGAVIKVSGETATTISLPGVQAYSLALDSDLRPAILGVEPGQVDNGSLLVTGTTSGMVKVVDTTLARYVQVLGIPGTTSLGSVSVNFGTRYAYVAGGSSHNVAILGPVGSSLPPMAPRIWSSEEVTWNRGFGGTFLLMATGDPLPSLSLLGELPDGITYVDNGNGTATLTGIPGPATEGDYPLTVIAANSTGIYAQAFGISVDIPPAITSGDTATFYVGTAGSFTVKGTGYPTPIFFTWGVGMPSGVELMDNEDGTASLRGSPTIPGTYTFTIFATTDCPPDAEQVFTLNVVDPASKPGGGVAPLITSADTTTWAIIGAPFPPDPFTVTSIGAPTPALSVVGELPFGVTFIDNGDSTATLGGIPWYAGTYTFTILAANDSGSTTQAFTLVVEPCTSIMSATPATLFFDYTVGGTIPAAQSVTLNTLGDTLPYAAVTTATWLVATPKSGFIDGATGTPLSVSVNLAGLAAGLYTGTVIVGSAGTEGPYATVEVSLTINDVPLMSVSPSAMWFDYAPEDGALPPPQTISLESGGVPLAYTVSTSASWLSATPAAGTTPGNVSISVNPKALGLGTYNGTVTIAAEGAGNGPQTIAVILFKKATHKKDFKAGVQVSFDVGSGPEGLALNRNTHQLFINTSNEAGADVEVSAGGAAEEAAPPSPGASSAVFRFDPSTGTVAGRTLVHSEGEYVAVNSSNGLVYHASQGTAEVAVIDGLADEVVTFIPLLFPEGPYQPYQIAIDEEQNFIYVGAKAPPIPDPVRDRDGKLSCPATHEMPDDEYDCWNPGKVFLIDGETNQVVASFFAGDDPEGVQFAAFTGKVYASNEDDGSMTVAQGAIRNKDGSITPPEVLSTIIRGVPTKGWWQPACDENNYCGERGQAALWPERSRCNGIDDEAEEADKMAVDPQGNVYVTDDRYRVAKINGRSDEVVSVLEIKGFDCERDVPDGSHVSFKNTANNIAFAAVSTGIARNNPNETEWRLYVVSEQDTLSLVDPVSMTLRQTFRVPGAVHLDAIATDPELNRVFISDEELSALFILQGPCANGIASSCNPK